MGYATALAWILFLIIFVLTMITLRSSALWVYSETEKK
jgi:ABC-type sugar transport system permease subunit